MSERTNVGNIYLDLIVRDTVDKQVQKIAENGQQTAQKAFSGVEKAAKNMTNKVAKAVGKAPSFIERSIDRMVEPLGGKFVKPVEKAKAQVLRLARDLKDIEREINEKLSNDPDYQFFGYSLDKDGSIAKLEKQSENIYKKMRAARENLFIEVQDTVNKQAAAEEAAARRAAAAAEKAAATTARAAEKRAAADRKAAAEAEAAAQKAAAAAEKAASRSKGILASVWKNMLSHGGSTEDGSSFLQPLSDFAGSVGKNIVSALSEANGSAVSFGQIASKAFNKAGGATALFGGKIGIVITAVRTAGNAITGVAKSAIAKVKDAFTKVKNVYNKISTAVDKLTGNFNSAGGSARRFSYRLREILSGALIFNGISVAIRSMVSYMGEAITTSDSMKQALANLKGAAANAASPLIQVLTPALVKLANAAATALTYVQRLMTMLTGKVSTAGAVAAKSAQTVANANQKAASAAEKSVAAAKKAQRSLAGFDEIERLSSNVDEEAVGAGTELDPGLSDAVTGEDEIQPNYDFKGFSPFLESILADIENGRWTQIGEKIAEKINSILDKIKWDEIQNKVRDWTQNLVDSLNGFIHKIDFGLIGKTIGEGLNTITTAIDTFFQGIDWKALGKGFADGLNRLADTVNWEQLGRSLTDGFKAVFEWLHGFVRNFDFSKFGSKIGQMLKAALGNIKWEQLAEDLNAGILGVLDMLIAFVDQIEWDKVGQTISDCFERFDWPAIGTKIGELLSAIDWETIISSVWEYVSEIFKAKFETVTAAISGCLEGVGEWLYEKTREAGSNIIMGLLKGMSDPIGSVLSWLAEKLVTPIIELVCSLLGIHSPSTVFAEIGKNTILGLLKGLQDTWKQIDSFLQKSVGDTIVKVKKYWEEISTSAKEAWEAVMEAWEESAEWFDTNFITPATDAFAKMCDSICSKNDKIWSDTQSTWNSIASKIDSAMSSAQSDINSLSGKTVYVDVITRYSSTGTPSPEAAGKAKTYFAGPQLATGGIIRQPTLAMVGEYSGARSNPEIVAPQSLMAETVAGVMEDVINSNIAGFEAVVAVLKDILEAILGIEIGDEVIGQAVARYNKKMAIVKGRT